MRFDPERDHRRSIRLKGYDYRTPGLYVVTICTQHRVSLLGEIVEGEMHPSPAGLMVQTVWKELPWAYPGVEIDAFVVMPNHVHGIVFLLPDDLHEPQVSGPEASVGGEGQAQGPAPTGNAPVGATPCGCPSPNDEPSRNKPPFMQTRGQDPLPARTGTALVGATPCGCPFPETTLSNSSNTADHAPERLSLPDVVHRFKTLTTKRYGDGVRNSGWTPYNGRLWQRNYHEHIVRNQDDLDRCRRYIEENPIRWSSDRHNPTNED